MLSESKEMVGINFAVFLTKNINILGSDKPSCLFKQWYVINLPYSYKRFRSTVRFIRGKTSSALLYFWFSQNAAQLEPKSIGPSLYGKAFLPQVLWPGKRSNLKAKVF